MNRFKFHVTSVSSQLFELQIDEPFFLILLSILELEQLDLSLDATYVIINLLIGAFHVGDLTFLF